MFFIYIFSSVNCLLSVFVCLFVLTNGNHSSIMYVANIFPSLSLMFLTLGHTEMFSVYTV